MITQHDLQHAQQVYDDMKEPIPQKCEDENCDECGGTGQITDDIDSIDICGKCHGYGYLEPHEQEEE